MRELERILLWIKINLDYLVLTVLTEITPTQILGERTNLTHHFQLP
nr:MAG TPA: hypothetical protein [Caudoviricetes sp.]